MMSFYTALSKEIEKHGYSLEDVVPTKLMTFREVADYYVRLTNDDYDHDLMHQIQLYQSNNLDVKDLFISKIEAIENSKKAFK